MATTSGQHAQGITRPAETPNRKLPLAIRLGRGVFFGFAIFLLCLVTAYVFGYRVNLTASYPLGIYQLDTKAVASKGELVLFCPPETAAIRTAVDRGYIDFGTCAGGYQPLMKKVAAEAGDTVSMDGFVRINGYDWPSGKIPSKDSAGRPMTKWTGGTIDKGAVLTLSDYEPYSFDGRYFGPVSISTIQGVMRPVWTWEQH